MERATSSRCPGKPVTSMLNQLPRWAVTVGYNKVGRRKPVGTDCYNYSISERRAAGQTATAASAIDEIPLFVREFNQSDGCTKC